MDLMNKVSVNELNKFVNAYLHNILLDRKISEDSFGHLQMDLQRLEGKKQTGKLFKCEFDVNIVQHLRHLNSESGVSVD